MLDKIDVSMDGVEVEIEIVNGVNPTVDPKGGSVDSVRYIFGISGAVF
jgi:hypothetical protein